VKRDRRNLLAALGAGSVSGLFGGIALERLYLEPKRNRRYYEKQLPIRGQNESLSIESNLQSVSYGEEITFKIQNTSDTERVNLGCNINWAIQRKDEHEGGWKHVTWTNGRFHDMCATSIFPGDTKA